MTITLQGFPTPVHSQNLRPGDLIVAYRNDESALGLWLNIGGARMILVLKDWTSDATGMRFLEREHPTQVARYDGQVVARPVGPPRQVTDEKGGPLTIDIAGNVFVRPRMQPGHWPWVNLLTGEFADPKAPYVTYPKWELVLVEGERETQLVEFFWTPTIDAGPAALATPDIGAV